MIRENRDRELRCFTTREAGAAASRVLASASDLARCSGELGREMEDFLGQITAA